MLRGHEGAILAARFNGDGNYCLSCGKDRTIHLWNPHRGIHIKTYKSHGREVRDVHVTLDNSKLISCGGDRQIFYWDVATGRVIRKFRGHDSESLRAWDCRSHSTEPIQIIDTFQDSVMSVCLTKTEMIAGIVDGTVRTFDIRIGREILNALGKPVNCISMSNDGNCILASCLDSTLRLLDRSTGERLQEYKGHTCKSYKLDCCLTNTDAHVTGGSEDGYIYFWDLVDATVVSSFCAHACSFANEGAGYPLFTLNVIQLLTLSLHQYNSALCKNTCYDSVRFFSISTAIGLLPLLHTLLYLNHSILNPFPAWRKVTSVSYHPRDNCMITASVDSTIRVWKS
ncbi:hypothetical protein MANES_12G148300v8 [Manihot esculenta]|uniref:Uncharacterized protein n=1 Tax=Manihot esculenta TaxID=3983 RepID=A0ACB7GT75_MANES|nr:hypothetical protein MANES_12G148300v8 [Manihot esculenta]